MRGKFAECAGRARLGDAVDGVVLQRAAGALAARHADAPRARSPAGDRARRQHARGVRRRRGRTSSCRARCARRCGSGSSGASRCWCCSTAAATRRRSSAGSAAHTIDCPNCSVSLTVHTQPTRDWRARCHYCNFSRIVPKQCPTCAAPYLEHIGFGTERVEAEIVALVSRRARRPRRSRHDPPARQPGAAAEPLRAARARRARRHADDRQGPRLSAT